MPSLTGFVGMMQRDPESVYDLLPTTLGDTNSESGFEGSCHLARECNMLHHSENGAAAGGEEDDAYPIPRTPGEQADYEQERLERAKAHEAEQANERHDGGCPNRSTSAPRAHGHGNGACTIRSNTARRIRPSSPEPAKMSLWRL